MEMKYLLLDKEDTMLKWYEISYIEGKVKKIAVTTEFLGVAEDVEEVLKKHGIKTERIEYSIDAPANMGEV